ncbi:MAG: 8-oxo-dGTP pyrophosphatase MutT (NUDIX family) [Halioglobus sp.]|jgi:8-oxo-dGTP pyrophosphatase MutT (NUDIX family)
MTDDVEVRPASTVVLLRDTEQGLETLLLRRNKALLFAGGAWVFPGGALDPEDFEGAEGDLAAASRVAAAREAQEESGLQPNLEDMVLLSHWTTPIGEPRRFSTWIYAAPVAVDEDVVIDGGEIHDSRWVSVRQAAEEHEAGDLPMLPPTYITLCNMAQYGTVAQMLVIERTSQVPEVFPVFTTDGDQVVVLFRGDAGYDTQDGSAPGSRHRAGLKGDYWKYYYQNVEGFARLMPEQK